MTRWRPASRQMARFSIGSRQGSDEAIPGEVIVDSVYAAKAGTLLSSTSTPGYCAGDYKHENNTGKGASWQRFTPSLPAAGSYQVYLRWTAEPNRASNVPVDIERSGGITTRMVDQRTQGGQWVCWSAPTTPMGVIADAARFVAA